MYVDINQFYYYSIIHIISYHPANQSMWAGKNEISLPRDAPSQQISNESLPHLKGHESSILPVNVGFSHRKTFRVARFDERCPTEVGFVRPFVRRARPHEGSETVTFTRTIFSFIRTRRHETVTR